MFIQLLSLFWFFVSLNVLVIFWSFVFVLLVFYLLLFSNLFSRKFYCKKGKENSLNSYFFKSLIATYWLTFFSFDMIDSIRSRNVTQAEQLSLAASVSLLPNNLSSISREDGSTTHFYIHKYNSFKHNFNFHCIWYCFFTQALAISWLWVTFLHILENELYI